VRCRSTRTAPRKGIPVPELAWGCASSVSCAPPRWTASRGGRGCSASSSSTTARRSSKDRDLNFVFQVRLGLRYERGLLWRPNRRGEDADKDEIRACSRCSSAIGRSGRSGTTPASRCPCPTRRGRSRRSSPRSCRATRCPTSSTDPVDNLVLGMAELGKLDGTGLERALTPLTEAYGAVDRQQRSRELDRPRSRTPATALVDKADKIKARIAAGIALLGTDAAVREAFCLANQAMHVLPSRPTRQREDPATSDGKRPAWRPFQLAFVLMNLASLADPRTPDRGSPTSSTSPPAAARPRRTSGSSRSRSACGGCAASRARTRGAASR
jgi:hypothetical protein